MGLQNIWDNFYLFLGMPFLPLDKKYKLIFSKLLLLNFLQKKLDTKKSYIIDQL